jgi:hypothetical protein
VRWGRAQQKAVKKAGGNPGGRNNRPTASREQAQQNGSSSNLVQFGEAAAGQESSAHLDSDTQPSSDKVSVVDGYTDPDAQLHLSDPREDACTLKTRPPDNCSIE